MRPHPRSWVDMLSSQNSDTSSCTSVQGKVLMLITNSDYLYTNKMMSFAYNRFMPPGKTWRDLFDMVCHPCAAGKQAAALLGSRQIRQHASAL